MPGRIVHSVAVPAGGRNVCGGRPLLGKRVVVTRARRGRDELSRVLGDMGARVVGFPAIRIRPVRAGRISLRGFTHVVFTSRTAVELFLGGRGVRAGALAGLVVCAVGERTARALGDRGVRVDVVAGEFTSRALARRMCRRGVRGARVLHPGADKMNPDLEKILRRHGARVTNLVLYRIEKASPRNVKDVMNADWITFASAQTVRNFVEAVGGRAVRARIACIGPVTARAARRLGLRVDAVPRRHTLEDLAKEIARKP